MAKTRVIQTAFWLALATCGRLFGGPTEIVWLRPETQRATPGAAISFELLASADFAGNLQPAFSAARVEAVRGTLAGQPLALGAWQQDARALRSLAIVSRPGVAILEVVLKPEARSVSRGDVDTYLNALHASDEIRAAWDEITPPNPWQEVHAVAAKAYVRVGIPPADDHDWREARVHGLDLTPVTDPTSANVNETFAVHVTRDGKAVSGVVVEFLSEGETREHVVLSGGDGTATARLNQPGRWLIRCFDVEQVHASNHDWETAVVALLIVAGE